MAKAAKKPVAKKASAKPAAKAKPEKKAVAVKKEAAPKKEVTAKKEAPVKVKAVKEVKEPKAPKEVAAAPVEEAAPAPKMSKKEKAAKAASDKLQSEDLKRWSDYKDKYGSEKAAPYNMSATFEANKPIQHKVLGWGFILSIQNDRLEVLFESGPKMLISNYKAG